MQLNNGLGSFRGNLILHLKAVGESSKKTTRSSLTVILFPWINAPSFSLQNGVVTLGKAVVTLGKGVVILGNCRKTTTSIQQNLYSIPRLAPLAILTVYRLQNHQQPNGNNEKDNPRNVTARVFPPNVSTKSCVFALREPLGYHTQVKKRQKSHAPWRQQKSAIRTKTTTQKGIQRTKSHVVILGNSVVILGQQVWML